MKVKSPPIATTALTSAIAILAGSSAVPAFAHSSTMTQKLVHMLKLHLGASKAKIMANMTRVQEFHLARCDGINAAGKNDCAAGVHSCAVQSTRNDDPTSFDLPPVGDCGKIAGGSLKGSM